MTNSKISQLAALMRSSELVNGPQKSMQQESSPVFGALLSQTSENGKKDAYAWDGNTIQPPKGKEFNQDVYVKEASGTGYRENPIAMDNAPGIQDKLPEDTPDKLKDFEEKVTEAVAEEFGVTVEEVKEAMETLGMTVLDLMEPSKLAGLVMELTGNDDIGSLLLSEDFQQILSEIGELSQDFMAELNLTPEEMPQFKEQLEAMAAPQEEELPATALQGEELPAAEPKLETVQTEDMELPETVEGDLKQDAEVSVSAEAVASADQKAKSENVKDAPVNAKEAENVGMEDEGKSESSPMEEVDAKEQENPQEDGKEESAGKSLSEMAQGSKNTEKAETPTQHHVTYQTTAQTVNQGQAIEVTQTIVQARVDVEDIMRQVSQMTRVMVSQAESSIEMQLNPANLGKVYLQVVSKEGVITAQLAAQNEAVKEALESQVAILKENMDQQGIKVEAIEVTIASHEFERNLEQNQQNPAQEQQEAEAQKASRRNINLNNPEELEGMMSEEENLAARMMAEQGNSIDLTA